MSMGLDLKRLAALEDSYGGLGTVIIAADGHSGSFALNDGNAAGHFDCGSVPSRQ